MDALVSKLIYLSLGVVLVAGVLKSVGAYWSGKEVKKEVKAFLIVCFFLGAAPGLTKIASNLGESIVSPVDAVVKMISSEITKSVGQ
jgi:hypothetical protein